MSIMIRVNVETEQQAEAVKVAVGMIRQGIDFAEMMRVLNGIAKTVGVVSDNCADEDMVARPTRDILAEMAAEDERVAELTGKLEDKYASLFDEWSAEPEWQNDEYLKHYRREAFVEQMVNMYNDLVFEFALPRDITMLYQRDAYGNVIGIDWGELILTKTKLKE